MSKRAPEPPVKRRNSGPLPVAVRVVETVVKVSQPPVGATRTEPSGVPVAEPARTSMVPPAPAEETFAVKVRAPAVATEA